MQVHYFLVPLGDPAFADRIEQHVRRIPSVIRHPDLRDRSWIVAATPQMAKWLEAKLKQDPRTNLITQGMLTLHPGSIEVWQDVPAEIMANVKPIILWIMQTWTCEVLSEEGEDWTTRYGPRPANLFVEEETWA